jgi:hypothetical protein
MRSESPSFSGMYKKCLSSIFLAPIVVKKAKLLDGCLCWWGLKFPGMIKEEEDYETNIINPYCASLRNCGGAWFLQWE